MPELTSAQYFTVYNLLSLAIASMMATFVFFALVRTEVSLKYRGGRFRRGDGGLHRCLPLFSYLQ